MYRPMFLCIKPLEEYIYSRFVPMKIVEYRVSWLRPNEKQYKGFDLNWQTYWIFEKIKTRAVGFKFVFFIAKLIKDFFQL